MLASPGLDAGDVGGAAEVILVLRLGPPPGLGLAFAFGAAGGLGAKPLTPTVAGVRRKEAFAMQALIEASDRGHSGGKKTDPTDDTHLELRGKTPSRKKIREEDGGRTKKRFS